MHTVTWSGSTTDITMREIIFDTSRLDSAGHPLPISEKLTTIHRQDSTQTTTADSLHAVSLHTEDTEQHATKTIHKDTKANSFNPANVITLAIIISLCMAACKAFRHRR